MNGRSEYPLSGPLGLGRTALDQETPRGAGGDDGRTLEGELPEYGTGGSGSANGEFSRMADAVSFAESWLQPGWTAMITNPDGVQVELEKGKVPEFPPTPGKNKGRRADGP